jgi:hypothetical protein
MATVLTTDVLTRASTILQDLTNVRWPQAELLGWLNDGQRELTIYKPNACVQNTDVVLVAGTKQTLPPDGCALVDITRNTGGNAIRIVSREVLDAQIPNWHLPANAKPTVIHFAYTENNPKTFYVYPPSPGGNSVEIIYNAAPANATLTSVISIDDIYSSALVDYVLYRAYSKDTEYAANGQSAADHYGAFKAAIQGRLASEIETDPNTRTKGNRNAV